jgi:hypothetical protein
MKVLNKSCSGTSGRRGKFFNSEKVPVVQCSVIEKFIDSEIFVGVKTARIRGHGVPKT